MRKIEYYRKREKTKRKIERRKTDSMRERKGVIEEKRQREVYVWV